MGKLYRHRLRLGFLKKISMKTTIGFKHFGFLALIAAMVSLLLFVPAACNNGTTPPGGTFTAVNTITGLPETGTTNVPLTLSGTVGPANATHKTIVWSIIDGGYSNPTLSGAGMNILTATWEGNVTIRATIVNGTAEGDYTQDFVIVFSDLFIPVTDIIYDPPGAFVGSPTFFSGGTGTVVPPNASAGPYSISWSMIDPGTTGAIWSPGMLRNTAVGTVKLRATIANGSAVGVPFTKDFDFKIKSPLVWKKANLNTAFTTSDTITSIAYFSNPINSSNIRFVAGTMTGKMAYSTDGSSWWPLSTTVFSQNGTRVYDIREAGQGGSRKLYAVGQNTIAWSDDGINWPPGNSLSFTDFNIKTFSQVDNHYYVAGQNGGVAGNMAFSATGTSGWTRTGVSIITGSIEKIHDGMAVGLNGYNAFAAATAGSWSLWPTELGGSHIYCAGEVGLSNPRNRVIAGADGKIAYRGGTSSTWINIPAGTVNNTTSTFGTSFIQAMEEGVRSDYNRYLLAGGSGGKMALSPDGQHWSVISNEESQVSSTTTIYGIAYGAIGPGSANLHRFVAVGSNGTIVYADLPE